MFTVWFKEPGRFQDIVFVFIFTIAKFSKPGFSNTGTVNFQMFKLVLEKAEEPEIKLPHPLDHGKSRRVPEKHLLLFY